MAAMDGKICLVTGATAGIGEVAARALAAQGATVIVHGRDKAKADAVKASMGGKTETLIADLSSLADVRRAAAEFRSRFDTLDVLLNNAGAINSERKLSKDGLELTFAVNHLAHFLLTRELRPLLEKTPGARIVNVASEASKSLFALDLDDLQTEKRYFGWKAYARSKRANILFSSELARRLPAGITSNALHPGPIASNFAQNSWWMGPAWKLLRPFLLTTVQGADTSIWLASAPEAAGITGKYFFRRREITPVQQARDPELARKLWDASERLVGT